ncbi:hypothetical protein OTU49_007265 [Cherax quadricarinatus]|uniref:Uncharacterized protein n=1 Tax=Cherax quadricarinatus TaxID=27406 RepID=A0AAW0WHT7_CHEQU|nr:uncharacterized protein LOC128698750 isoform X1 [Cherax quadricarinatus]
MKFCVLFLVLLCLFCCSNASLDSKCTEGWTGADCRVPVCMEGCHQLHGNCTRPGECLCTPGWRGRQCNECVPRAGCQHGSCTSPDECLCNQGWSGHLCSQPVCSNNCSQAHGHCTKPGECRCEVGWWGKRCDMCFPYPGCDHGSCKEPWECVCEPGWTGMLCDTREPGGPFCEGHQGWCLNGGTCIDTGGGRNYTCSCPSLFTGQRCDYLAEPSIDHPSARTGLLSTSSHNIQVISQDTASPLGTYSITHPTTDTPEGTGSEEDPKDARRRLLQKHARISFRQPKLANSEEDSGKLPYTVVERKLLPLPVVLPRVSDIIPGGRRPAHKSNKQPTPILILGSSVPDSIQGSTQASEISGRNQINENRRFLRHQQETPGFLTETRQEPGNEPALIKVLNSQRRPILVSAYARALPRSNPLIPTSPRTQSRPRQQVVASRRPTTTPPTITLPTTPAIPKQFVTSTTRASWRGRQEVATDGRPEGLSLLPPVPSSWEIDDVEGRESVLHTYYDENVNGRVHIGDTSSVDHAAPHKEIYDAFIELKKV